MNTFSSESKHFTPLKIIAEVFFFYSPSPMNIKPLLLEKKEQIKQRIFISQLHVSGNGGSESVFGGRLDACFSFWEKLRETRKVPLRFNYLSILFFTTKTLTLLLRCSVEKKKICRRWFCFFFLNGKSSITSKRKCSAFLVFDRKSLSSWNNFKVTWRFAIKMGIEKTSKIRNLGYCPFASVFRSIVMTGNTNVCIYVILKESFLYKYTCFMGIKDGNKHGHQE